MGQSYSNQTDDRGSDKLKLNPAEFKPYPLSGIKVVEFAGLAPGPFCGLFLADWGASVIRIDRPNQGASLDVLARGKRSLAINSKTPAGRRILRKLISQADVLIDPFRPGVLERLGLGPDVFLGRDGLNARLVYTRIVGFARTGHHKDMAGHDLNYLAISGVLSMMPPSRADGRPSFPLNILADFAGGGLTAAAGVLLALFERHTSNRGQVVESDMVSGTRYASSFPLIHQALRSPLFSQSAGSNALDGGAPYYSVYRCKDGRWFTVGALEPQFYATFLRGFLGALPPDFTAGDNRVVRGSHWRPRPENQFEREEWADLFAFFEAGFMTKTRDEWTDVFHGTDACALPVLSPSEAVAHTSTTSAIPKPHPDLSRTPAQSSLSGGAVHILSPGTHNEEILRELGISETEREELANQGAIGPLEVANARL